jgi:hypothetical protein
MNPMLRSRGSLICSQATPGKNERVRQTGLSAGRTSHFDSVFKNGEEPPHSTREGFGLALGGPEIGPIEQCEENRRQRLAEGGEAIFHLGRNLGVQGVMGSAKGLRPHWVRC